jgi:hypothetical protein
MGIAKTLKPRQMRGMVNIVILVKPIKGNYFKKETSSINLKYNFFCNVPPSTYWW